MSEWKVTPVKRKDGSIWLGLACISDGERDYGAFNEQQAIAICEAHNAATAKLREEVEWWRNHYNTDMQIWGEEIVKLCAGSEKQICDLQDENSKLREENERLLNLLKVRVEPSVLKRLGILSPPSEAQQQKEGI